MFLGPYGQPQTFSKYDVRYFELNEHLLGVCVNMCAWGTVQSPCICTVESSTEAFMGGVRIARGSWLSFIVAWILSIQKYFQTEFTALKMHIAQTDESEIFNPAI